MARFTRKKMKTQITKSRIKRVDITTKDLGVKRSMREYYEQLYDELEHQDEMDKLLKTASTTTH